MSNNGPRRKLIKDLNQSPERRELGLADGMVAFDEDLEKHKFYSPEKQPKPAVSVYPLDDSKSEVRMKAMNAITHARHLVKDTSQVPTRTNQQNIPQQVGFEVEPQSKPTLSRRLFK